MSLTEITALTLTSEGTTSGAEINQASGPVPYSPSEDGYSSMLADLVAMFPSLDYEVIVTVLQAHDGRIQATVEYLMTANTENGEVTPVHTEDLVLGCLNPARDMVGQFSDDIGGLPEVLPRFLCEGEVEDEDLSAEEGEVESGGEDSSTGDAHSHSPMPPQGSHGFVDTDPLPTYDEACREMSPQSPPDNSHFEAEPKALGPNNYGVAISNSLTGRPSSGASGTAAAHSKKSKLT